MKIFGIFQDEYNGYDTFSGHVIVANNTEEVVLLARNKRGDQGELAWKEENVEEVGIYTGKETEPFILLSSYHAG